MSNVTLTMRDIRGKNHTMTVPKNTKVSNLMQKIKTNLGIPISKLTHAGYMIESSDKPLSDLLFIDYSKPFYLIPRMVSGAAKGGKRKTRKSKTSRRTTRRR